MTEILSIIIATVALAISAITAYLTLFRRGDIRMTAPTVIFFGPDGGARDESKPPAKVYLRSLLYATSKRGRVIESMFVRLRRGESLQTFNVWVLGEESLARGSGLFVGENGVACNHHFLLPADGTQYGFLPGEYRLEVFCSLAGSKRAIRLTSIMLVLETHVASQLNDPEMGVYFDWGPDSSRYHAHVRPRSERQLPEFLKQLAGSAPPPDA